MQIITNSNWREFVYGSDLSIKEKENFDYMNIDELESGSFIRYKGIIYDLGEFMAIRPPIAPHCQREGWTTWDRYQSDSFFSGILLRLSNDGDQYQIATYYS